VTCSDGLAVLLLPEEFGRYHRVPVQVARRRQRHTADLHNGFGEAITGNVGGSCDVSREPGSDRGLSEEVQSSSCFGRSSAFDSTTIDFVERRGIQVWDALPATPTSTFRVVRKLPGCPDNSRYCNLSSGARPAGLIRRKRKTAEPEKTTTLASPSQKMHCLTSDVDGDLGDEPVVSVDFV